MICRLKEAQIFAIFIRGFEYWAKKKAKPETDSKTIILADYYGLLGVFLKKDLEAVLVYSKYDHKINKK